MNNQDILTGRHFLKLIDGYKCNHLPCGDILTIEEYQFKNGSKNCIGFCKRLFDEQGALTSETFFNAEGIATTISSYEYDLADCLASIETHFIQSNEKAFTKYVLYPDENVIGKIIQYEDGTEKETVFMIDSRGRIAGKYNNKNRDNIEVVEFDSLDRIVTYTTENIQGEVTHKDELEYGSSIEYVQLKSFAYPDKILFDIQRIYSYDTQGNWVRMENKIKMYESGKYRGMDESDKTRLITYRRGL